MSTKFYPALKYELKNIILGCTPFFAVIVAVVAFSIVGTMHFGMDVSFSGYSAAAAICLFVFGVVEPRPCIRLCAQFGASRRTAFLSNLLAALVAALLLSVGGELLLMIGRALSGDTLFLADLYQLIYLSAWSETNIAMSLSAHFVSILFSTLLLFAAYCGGMFFTFLFWRLNKLWTVVAAIAIPVLLNLIPWLISRSGAAVKAASALFTWLMASAWNFMLLCVLVSALISVICWLLVFRANIRAPSGK